MTSNNPLDLDAIEALTTNEHLTPGPWRLDRESCDCSDGYCHHGMYVTGVVTPIPTAIAAERLARNGEQPRDYDFHRGEIGDFPEADWELMVAAREALPALVAEVRRLRAQVVDLGDENAKLIRWHREDGAYEQRLREQHDRDVAELSSVRAERDQARARIAELERPAVEAKRNEIRQSYSELIAQCEQDRDFEGAFDVQCRLREREEQWAAEDAANQPTAPAARSAAV